MATRGVAVRRFAVLWLAAVALILSAGTGFSAALNSGGMHGHGGVAQRQGSDRHGFEHHRDGFEHRRDGFVGHRDGFIGHREFDRFHHFHRHSRFIIIGDPFFGVPIYYAPPLYVEQYPPAYVVPYVNYSYYCTDPSGYYPEIQSCPNGWLQVIPDTSPD